MKKLDENLPSDLEEIINKYNGMEAVMKSVKENAAEASDTFAEGYRPQLVSLEPKEAAVVLHLVFQQSIICTFLDFHMSDSYIIIAVA